jgi:hypothetical protein
MTCHRGVVKGPEKVETPARRRSDPSPAWTEPRSTGSAADLDPLEGDLLLPLAVLVRLLAVEPFVFRLRLAHDGEAARRGRFTQDNGAEGDFFLTIF